MTKKMINLKITEEDLMTLNNLLSCLLDDNDSYSHNDIIAVLNKVRRTAIVNHIELVDWR